MADTTITTKAGDTLESIAQLMYGTKDTAAALAQQNSLAVGAALAPGTQLIIPFRLFVVDKSVTDFVSTIMQMTMNVVRKAVPRLAISQSKTALVAKDAAAQTPRTRVNMIVTDEVMVPIAFDGAGVLELDKPELVSIFATETGGTPLAMPLFLTAAEMQAGKSVFVQAKGASSALDDVQLSLRLEAKGHVQLAGNGTAIDKLTCIEVTLDICKARDPASPATDPAVIPVAEKRAPGRFVHVQDKDPRPIPPGTPALTPADKLRYERAKVIVRAVKPAAWKGTLALQACDAQGKDDASRLQIFADEVAAKSQAALAQPVKVPHQSGFTDKAFFVQGLAPSAALQDAAIKLGVDGLKNSQGLCVGDRVALTVIKSELALGQSRKAVPAAGALPDAFNDSDKVTKGRFVHVQAGILHGRGAVIVKQVVPAAFNAKLKLTVFDLVSNAASVAKLALFDDEVPAAGQAAKAASFDVDHNAAFPAQGKPFFAEGKAVSARLVDSEVRLSFPGHINLCDAVNFTSVQLHDFKAVIPPTPANTARAVSPAPDSHDFIVGAGTPAQKDFDEDFVTNKPLVLMENSLGAGKTVALEVKVTPAGAPVSWSVQRDKRPAPNGDAAAIVSLPGNRADGPTITPDAANKLKATMKLDAVGSFHVRPFIDCNGTNKFEGDDATNKRIDREPFLIANLVLVRAQMKTDTSRARPGNAAATSNAAGVRLSTGQFGNGAVAGVHCKAIVTLTGGGADGKRGLDFVFAGWCNNETPVAGSPAVPPSEDAVSIYTAPPSATVHQVFSFWQTTALGGPPFPVIGPGMPMPPAVAGPTLDCTNFGNEGTGGDSATGTEGAPGPPTAIVKVPGAGAIGEDWTIEMWDSPGDGAGVNHPFQAGFTLSNYRFNLDFRTDLLFWTSEAKNKSPTPGRKWASRLYASVATHRWTIRYATPFTPGVPIPLPVGLALTKDGNPTKRAIPVEGSGLEVRGPITLRMLATNAAT